MGYLQEGKHRRPSDPGPRPVEKKPRPPTPQEVAEKLWVVATDVVYLSVENRRRVHFLLREKLNKGYATDGRDKLFRVIVQGLSEVVL